MEINMNKNILQKKEKAVPFQKNNISKKWMNVIKNYFGSKQNYITHNNITWLFLMETVTEIPKW